MFTVSRETKATLVTQAGGKVVGWHTDKESRHVSIAVTGDRAKLTPVEARNLAAWLIDAAKEAEKVSSADSTILRNLGTAARVSTW